jgi:hypothetical protein
MFVLQEIGRALQAVVLHVLGRAVAGCRQEFEAQPARYAEEPVAL